MEHKGLLKSYILGFLFSIVLTMASYLLVYVHISTSHTGITHEFIVPILLFLAFIQLIVQLFFFLHMGSEKKPRWNMIVFITFIGLILLIVISSQWIMHHLNYMMPHAVEKKILEKELMINPGYSDAEKQKQIQDRYD